MTTPHTFTSAGARRVVKATRAVEANDPLYTGPRSRRQRPTGGPEQFVLARVAAWGGAAGTVTATEQVWSDEDGAFIALPGGRVWDGEDNLAVVRIVDGLGYAPDQLVTLGHRWGVDSSSQWFVLPAGGTRVLAKITGSASISTNRWKYAWTEQARTATGFADAANARTGTTSAGFAINSAEATNTGSGIEGNSIDLDGQIFTDNTGLELQPVRGTPTVELRFDWAADGSECWTFEYVNAIDGECGSA